MVTLVFILVLYEEADSTLLSYILLFSLLVVVRFHFAWVSQIEWINMGSGYSQEEYNGFAVELYQTAKRHLCLLPDIGIEKSLLKYSGTDSNAVLQAYSNELLTSTPGFIDRLGSSLAPLTVIPNAVGFGAFLISMIMEICIKSATTNTDSYSLLRNVFGEEKGSAVRDTMSEVMKRHETFMNNDQRLREEIQRIEAKLSHELTTLRNSLLYDGQMRSRGFKIWVNGASFHIQMMIFEAQLNVKTGKLASDYVNAIKATINQYLRDLQNLLEKYKTFKTSTPIFSRQIACGMGVCGPVECYMRNEELGCVIYHEAEYNYCSGPEMTKTYMNYLFSTYEPVSGLKSHFSDMKNNLYSLINQRGSFTLPSSTDLL